MTMLATCVRALVLAATMAAGFAAPSVRAEEATAEALVDALNAVFGKHAKTRSGHAKGYCVKGTWTPSAEAAGLSKAAHFTGGELPIVGRFSLGGGNPEAADNGKEPARGLAVKFDMGGKGRTDLVLISAPVFLAKTPDQFLTLLKTVATKDGEKIKAYFAANPESTRQGAWLGERPVPASYATVSYYSVHAFRLVDAAGKKQVVKWKVVPAGGEVGLTDDDAKTKGPNFYVDELKERLAVGPAKLTLNAVLGEAGDPVDDPTALWPEDRKTVAMGTIAITALEDQAVCDGDMFDPTSLIDGIEGPAEDKIFPMRSPAYAVSLTRRSE